MRRSAPSTYSYLYRYDRVWLTKHTPTAPIRQSRAPVVDWSRRDHQLRKRAVASINALRNAPGRPVRLRFTTITRHMGCAALLERRDVPLPRTLALIRASVESPLDAARRRISWAATQLDAARAQPARWQLVRAAGLRAALADALTPELDAAMDQIWTTYPNVAVVA